MIKVAQSKWMKNITPSPIWTWLTSVVVDTVVTGLAGWDYENDDYGGENYAAKDRERLHKPTRHEKCHG